MLAKSKAEAKSKARKSWSEKLNDLRPRAVKPAPKNFADIKAGQTMLLTTPRDVAEAIRAVPVGSAIDIKTLRAQLAQAFGAEMACPVVTGIHVRTVAEAVGEQLDAGIPPHDVVPVWRVVGPKSTIWGKLENGRSAFAALRQVERLDP
jgi:6-O-methylguanine DNA methyltransferase, DNA binding domain